LQTTRFKVKTCNDYNFERKHWNCQFEAIKAGDFKKIRTKFLKSHSVPFYFCWSLVWMNLCLKMCKVSILLLLLNFTVYVSETNQAEQHTRFKSIACLSLDPNAILIHYCKIKVFSRTSSAISVGLTTKNLTNPLKVCSLPSLPQNVQFFLFKNR
jgi:hypothetical protein